MVNSAHGRRRVRSLQVLETRNDNTHEAGPDGTAFIPHASQRDLEKSGVKPPHSKRATRAKTFVSIGVRSWLHQFGFEINLRAGKHD